MGSQSLNGRSTRNLILTINAAVLGSVPQKEVGHKKRGKRRVSQLGMATPMSKGVYGGSDKQKRKPSLPIG